MRELRSVKSGGEPRLGEGSPAQRRGLGGVAGQRTRRSQVVITPRTVYGKTGTAEYGAEVPPRTHAWFVGSQGRMAVAVLVADTKGSFGGAVAAPIATTFFSSLGHG